LLIPIDFPFIAFPLVHPPATDSSSGKPPHATPPKEKARDIRGAFFFPILFLLCYLDGK
jgi:hypothetical protein